jgi:hypothetical protein
MVWTQRTCFKVFSRDSCFGRIVVIESRSFMKDAQVLTTRQLAQTIAGIKIVLGTIFTVQLGLEQGRTLMFSRHRASDSSKFRGTELV